MKMTKKYGESFFFGLVAGLGLLLPLLWWVTLLAIALWFLSFDKNFSKKQALLFGWLFGFGKALMAISWFWTAYPVEWMGFEPGLLQIFVLILYWVPISFSMGVGLGLFAVSYLVIPKKLNNKFLLVGTMAVLWTIGEALGAVGFSIFTIGPGSSINAGFSYGNIGYVLVNHNLLFKLATLGGVYLLTLVAVLLILFGINVLTSPRQRIVFITIFLLSSLVPVFNSGYKTVGHKVAVVESYFPNIDSRDFLKVKENELESFRLVKEALESGAKTIILPEDFRFTTYFDEPADVLRFISNVTDKEVVLVDSAKTTLEDGSVVLRAYVYELPKGEVYVFDKNFLVPQGEFVPYIYSFLIDTFLEKQEFAGWVEQETRYVPGIDQRNLELPDSVPPVLFCFESSVPGGASSIKREDSLFIAHPISHGWFQHNQGLIWVQQEAMLKVQAAYTDLPILQSANEAQAKVFLPNGKVYTAGDSYDGEHKVLVFEI